MGTWDIGFFDNDMACDWENEIDNNTDLTYIENALLPATKNIEEELDIDLGNKALAASEALARLINKDGVRNSYTEHLDRWVDRFDGAIPTSLMELALASIANVTAPNSELLQFRKIRGEYDNWISTTEKLKERIKSNNEK